MIYFTSDWHLRHKNILRICDRPFSSIEEMEQSLISNWNNKVDKNDEVYILGDFGFFSNYHAVNEVLDKLNGHKHLIIGNHDKYLKQNRDKLKFDSIKDYKKIKHEGVEFILSHYPYYEWDGFFRNSIMLHGHVHTGTKGKKQLSHLGRIYDVGVDANNMQLVSIEKIFEKMKNINNTERNF